jgi:nonsense-mediated mRNA decay protein 3
MTKSDAKRMLDFLMAVVPARFKTSEQLVSHDLQSNVYNFKVAEGSNDVPCAAHHRNKDAQLLPFSRRSQYTFSVEIVPVCKEDVVCMSKSLANHFGGMS